jgi:aryl-alcohol dehydrogenase-like predicted oxidoreductase
MAVSKRELGRTGLQVTTLGYGAMELRGAPRARDITEAQAETILNAVLDAGINYIDTSIDYGLSEERIGRYIAHRRAEYYLASNAAAWSARRRRRAVSAACMFSLATTSWLVSSKASRE